MYKINLYSVGKNKEAWLEDALNLYQKRMQKQVQLHFNWFKSSELLLKALQKENQIFCFDPKGVSLTSESFAKTLEKGLIEGGSQVTFVIGEAHGLTQELKNYPLISLSKMIFTHQLTRLVVAEQIYRAVQIWNNSPYHFS
ncbi:MAG: Ribosomal RNA large subunit methyltransferase H [Chlamydiae bacterium]|nr:Ribosomal RNA large subunit methyltransferase H [Chlamydiota bacterium]